MPDVSTLVELLRWRATHQPNQIAYTFLLDGETEFTCLTYRELDQCARSVAMLLQNAGATGRRALLIYPPGLAYITAFFGCLYADVVAIPAYPPNPAKLDRTLPRLCAIVQDANPVVALTTTAIAAIAESLFAYEPDFKTLRWLATDTATNDYSAAWCPPSVTADTLAFLQYTSGSTSNPKGVMLSHGNLLHNLVLIQRAFAHSSASQGVIWLPPYHDMGLIGGILQPLYSSFPVTLMSPIDFLQRPFRWLQAITRYKATTSGGPNFAYDLCVRKITPEQRATLDLSSWTVAFNGAEAIRPDTMKRFGETFAACGFRETAWYPCYGLAESTLMVSGGQVTDLPVARTFCGSALEAHRVVTAITEPTKSQTLIGCGQALGDQQVVVVEPKTLARCAPDQIGEIWVSGASVAQGYWNRPEETKYSFQAFLSDSGAGPFLRTGDLGFLRDGELFVTGRLKDLIIIRGRNYYPQDIELTVERSHPALRPGGSAAFSIDVAGEEQLVVVQEVERRHQDAEIDTLAAAIREAVARQHELHIYAVTLLRSGSIPKTSSGKIQRYLCREGYLKGCLDAIASSVLEVGAKRTSGRNIPHLSRAALLATIPENRQSLLVDYLQGWIEQVLGASTSEVDVDQPINTLGLDSLMAIELQHALESDLEEIVSMTSFLQDSSIVQIANEILRSLARSSLAPKPVLVHMTETSASHPLSVGQRALWFLHQLAPRSVAYNLAFAARIRSKLDVPALRSAFQALIVRHSILRTTFIAYEGEPAQRIHGQMDVSFREEDASNWQATTLNDRLLEEAQRSFDLERGPLLRITLFRRPAHEHVILLAAHHIVVDLWSLTMLLHELGTLYSAGYAGQQSLLAAPVLGYTDYVRWQIDMLAGQEGERLWDYWRGQLSGALSVLELPTDRPRMPIQTYRGAVHSFTLDVDLIYQLNTLAKANGATLYTMLLAAFQALLYRYTGQDDILIGSPTTGRSRSQFADIVGYFVNPVVLRARCADALAFTALLAQVRATVIAALAHQDYPFGLLVERLQPERDPSRSPLFQVMFVMQKPHQLDTAGIAAFALGRGGAQLTIGELEVETLALEQQVAQVDLTLTLAEVAGRLEGALQYNVDLFDTTTIARMAEHLQTLLVHVAADSNCHLSDLPLLTADERRQVLVAWNTTSADYPHMACIHGLFEIQMARTPDAVALVFDRGQGSGVRGQNDGSPLHPFTPSPLQQLTYYELNRRANQLAHYLRQCGIEPEVRVGIGTDRSGVMVIGLLAILKVGGAYVPLDLAYPPARLVFMLNDAQAPVLLTQRHLCASLPSDNARVICLDEDWPLIAQFPEDNPVTRVSAANLAYVIYTSGSTGQPKGVMITHRSAVALLAWTHTIFTPAQLAGVLATTSICFDLSVFELFVPLSCGGMVILAENAVNLPARLASQPITLINTVPSAIRELLRIDSMPNSVGIVNLAGEPLQQSLVGQLYQRDSIQQVFNLYGPSEDTTYSSFAIMPRTLAGTPAIGRPIANTQIYVLDSRMQPTPIGLAGELYIGGHGLARGYLRRPDLTAERFVPNPFAEDKETRSPPTGAWQGDKETEDAASETQNSKLKTQNLRLYRTGDLARYRASGEIEFLGRIDHQVKIRGFRIEPGEIEATILQHSDVYKTVVVEREDVAGDKRLVAYIVTTNTERPGRDGSFVGELRRFLRTKLPEHSVPSSFVELAALPLTPNGKIDRKALPVPDRARPVLDDVLVPPCTPLEEDLARMWAQVLNLEQVGIYDNFFALGGHSLLAIQLLSRLRTTLQIEVPVHRFFEAPTIAGLSKHIEMIMWASQDMCAAPGAAPGDREEGQL